MKTRIKKTGDAIIVTMDGRLDFETAVPLREDLSRIITAAKDNSKTDSVAKKIIFNLENLEFVGSSGISNFVQTMREFNTSSPSKPRYCNVGSEFKRVIKAYDEENLFEFFDNEDKARKGSLDN